MEGPNMTFVQLQRVFLQVWFPRLVRDPLEERQRSEGQASRGIWAQVLWLLRSCRGLREAVSNFLSPPPPSP